MADDVKVTLIHEDGMIIKENPSMFNGKTVMQIIQMYHPKDYSKYVLGIRTPTIVEILRPYSVPLNRYPLLKIKCAKNDFSIPQLSLCILNESEKDKFLIVLQPIDESQKDIKFPPFVYCFSKKDNSKTMATVNTEICKYFGVSITNPRVFIGDKDMTSFYCQKFIEEVTKMNNQGQIIFKFNLTSKGKEKLIQRQKYVNEMIDVIRRFCSDIIQFHNQVGKKIQESKVFSDFEYKTIFGSLIDMFKASTRFTTALTGNNSYDSYVGNIIFKYIPDLEENFKEFIANYRTDQLIPEIIKKYKDNQLLETIVHQTFGKSAISFESMTILPIQILPRYKLLFDNILNNTPISHPEFLLFQKNVNKIDKTIQNLENYNSVREVSYLQNRMIPLSDFQNSPLDTNARFLINKYNVSISLISKGTLYLLNDLIILTKNYYIRESEVFRYKYDEFIFFPNLANLLIVYYNKYNNQFETIKFLSVDIMKEMLKDLTEYRKKAFELNPNKNNALIAYENVPEDNQSIPQMVDSSCYKINSMVLAASSGVYLKYEINNKSLYFFKKVKNIHPNAKLVGVENSPYIYGGEKFPIPLEFAYDRFVELDSNEIGFNELEFGRIYHTCCSYKKFIVIFGGYKQERKNHRTYSSDVYFFNVKTKEWILSKSGFEAEPEARYKHSAIIYKNIMIIHGGISCKTDQVLDDTWFYNFNDGKWSIFEFGLNNNIICPRFGHSAVMVNQFMFIIGGLTNPRRSSNDLPSDSQISIENSNSSSSTMNSSSNSETSNSEEEELAIHGLPKNKVYVPATNCFCLDIENCRLFSIDIIGNFLPGLSLFSSIYDNYNKQIMLIGGHYLNNKEEKNTSIFIKMSIPQIFTSSTIQNNDDIVSIGRRINRNKSVTLFRPTDLQAMRKDDSKCFSSENQKPISINSFPDKQIKTSPSTVKKLVIPKIFLT